MWLRAEQNPITELFAIEVTDEDKKAQQEVDALGQPVKQNAFLKRQAKLHNLKLWKSFFQPIMHRIGLMMQDVKRAAEAAARLRRVMSGEMTAEQWEKAEDELAAALQYRAFEKHADPAGIRAAADYAGKWYNAGPVRFRAYYVCMAGGDDERGCCTMMVSTKWRRRHEDMVATGQRWYCRHCGAKCKTRWGVICEFVQGPGKPDCWLRARVPDEGTRDVRFLNVEETHGKDAQTPQHLLGLILVDGNTMWTNEGQKLGTPIDGCYSFEYERLKALAKPTCWASLMTGLNQAFGSG